MKRGSWALETNFFTSLLQPLAFPIQLLFQLISDQIGFLGFLVNFPFGTTFYGRTKKTAVPRWLSLAMWRNRCWSKACFGVFFFGGWNCFGGVFCGGEEIQKNSRSWLNWNTMMLCLAVTIAHSGNIRNDDPPDVKLLARFFLGLSRLRNSSQVTWSFREILCWGAIWFNKSRQIDQLKRVQLLLRMLDWKKNLADLNSTRFCWLMPFLEANVKWLKMAYPKKTTPKKKIEDLSKPSSSGLLWWSKLTEPFILVFC